MRWTSTIPATDGPYWWKLNELSDPELLDVCNGLACGFGEDSVSVSKYSNGVWLGPISPAHAEMLGELVEALERMTHRFEMCARVAGSDPEMAAIATTDTHALLNRARQLEGRG